MRKPDTQASRKGSRKVSSLARGAWQLYSSRVAEPNRSGLRAREGERLWRHGAWGLNWCWRAHCGRGWVGHASDVIRKININMHYNLIIIYLDFLIIYNRNTDIINAVRTCNFNYCLISQSHTPYGW